MTKVGMGKNNETAGRAIREEGVRRADRKETLNSLECLKRAEKRARNSKKRNMSSLVEALQSFGPPPPDDQTVRVESNIPPTKMPERIKGRRRGRS
jgi:hypothetical protein